MGHPIFCDATGEKQFLRCGLRPSVGMTIDESEWSGSGSESVCNCEENICHGDKKVCGDSEKVGHGDRDIRCRSLRVDMAIALARHG